MAKHRHKTSTWLTATLRRPGRLAVIAGLCLLFAAAGLVAMRQSKAATYSTAAEAESGSRAGATAPGPASGASAAGSVRFGGSTPAPPPNPADRVFTDDFEGGSLGKWFLQSCPNAIQVVSGTARKGNRSVKLSVSDGDTRSRCGGSNGVPTEDPRAQMIIDDDPFRNGDEYYIGFSTLFPSNLPRPTSWFQVAQVYGRPFGGSPSMGLYLCGYTFCFQRGSTYGDSRVWTATSEIRRNGTWEDIVLHIKFSTGNDGFVEIWRNGVKQTLSNGSQRMNYVTLKSGLNYESGGTNSLFLNIYRDADARMGTTSLHHDEVYIGRTYESVAR